MLLDKEKVLKFLPHRDPFLFIDSVDSIVCNDWELGGPVVSKKEVIGCEVIANYFADPDLEIFKGHFPGKPIFPGVIQVEMMAQASSFVVCSLHPNPFVESSLDVALVSVNNAKFRKPVLPGMNLKIKSKCVRYRAPIMSRDCMIFHEDELVSECTILASVKY